MHQHVSESCNGSQFFGKIFWYDAKITNDQNGSKIVYWLFPFNNRYYPVGNIQYALGSNFKVSLNDIFEIDISLDFRERLFFEGF